MKCKSFWMRKYKIEIKISHSRMQSCLNLEQTWEISTCGNMGLPCCDSPVFTATLLLSPAGSILQKPDLKVLRESQNCWDTSRDHIVQSPLKQGQLEQCFQDWVKLGLEYKGGPPWNYPHTLFFVNEHLQQHRNFKTQKLKKLTHIPPT